MRFIWLAIPMIGLALSARGEAATMKAHLAVDGKSSWRIYLPPNAGKVEQFAADELTKYVERMSGARLARTTGASSSHTILLGLRRSVQGLPDPKPGSDGYSILVSADRIVIAGDNPRGVLYGVYDLLERLGCRWYFPTIDPKDPEVVPHKPDLSLPAGGWSESARIRDRLYWVSGMAFKVMPESVAQIDWAAKNRYSGISWQCVPEKMDEHLGEMESKGVFAAMEKRGLMLHGPGHSFPYFLATDKYFKEHREWFGMLKGERQPHGGKWPAVNFCMSNPQACQAFIRNAETFAKKHPQIRWLDLLPIDGGIPCDCEECLRSTPTDLLIGLYNKLADRLRTVAPNVIVDCIPGYGQLSDPPSKVFPSDRLSAIYAHWGRNHSESYDDPQYGRRPNLLTWKSYFKSFMICSYYAANSHQPFVGPPFVHAIEGDTKFMVEHGVTGAHVLEYPFGFWWNNAFNVRLGGLHPYYYPKHAPASELKDFALTYYGPKAGPVMADYFEVVGAPVNLERIYKASRGESDDWEAGWLKALQAMVKRAAQLAEGDPVYAYRVSKLDAVTEMLTHLGPTRSKVIEIETAAADPNRNDDEIRRKIADARTTAADLIAHAQKLADMNSGIMDVEWFKGWTINRTYTEPLDRVEKKLAQ